jgi:hypothetical protein
MKLSAYASALVILLTGLAQTACGADDATEADEGSIILQIDDSASSPGTLHVRDGSIKPVEDGFVVEGLISTDNADTRTEAVAQVDKIHSPPRCFRCYWCSGSQCSLCEEIPCPKR